MQRYVKLLAVFILCLLPGYAALPATSVWEIRVTNGTDTNGAGFDSSAAGTDMSQFNNKNATSCTSCQSATNNLSTTDLSTTTTGGFTATSATAAFTSAITGNLIYLTGGTGGTVTTGWYRATFASSTTINLDRSPGAVATNVTMNIGGAIKTLGQLNTIWTGSNMNTTGQMAWVKAEATVNITSTITLSPNGGSTSNEIFQISAYTSSRGDNGQLTIAATSSGPNPMIQSQPAGGLIIRNLVLNAASHAGVTCLYLLGTGVMAQNILAENCTTYGIEFNNQNNICFKCTITGMGASGTAAVILNQSNGPNYCIDCTAYANASPGFEFNGSGICIRCISANNTGASSDGFNAIGSNAGSVIIDHCIAYKNGRDGFRFTNPVTLVYMQNSVAYGNTSGQSINNSGSVTLPAGAFLLNYNAYDTAPDFFPAGANDVPLTADPFVAGASNNFAPNSTTGGGKSLKAAGWPGALTVGGTGFPDIGALQSAAATGGGQKGYPIVQ